MPRRFRSRHTQSIGSCLFESVAVAWAHAYGVEMLERDAATRTCRELAVNQLAVRDIDGRGALRSAWTAGGAGACCLYGPPDPDRVHHVGGGVEITADALTRGSGREPGEGFGDYAQRMLDESSWGGESELVALSACLRAKIIAYCRDGDGFRREYGIGRSIRVLYGQSHYRPLLPEDAGDSA